MLFNSIAFIIFLPIVFLLYWFVLKKLKYQNILILVASYVFYGWWDYRFLSLLLFSTLLDFFISNKITVVQSQPKKRKLLWVSIFSNLSLLMFFKYYNFFIDSWIELFASIGYSIENTWTLNIILPVGISFYTFQTLSYTLDVYKGKLKPTNNLIAFGAYVSFFPQLVAGPIERAVNLLPQILEKRKFRYDQFVTGLRLILWGMFKKVVIADSLAPHVNDIFGNYESYDSGTLWLGAIYFSIQIYCDFSGYSDIAIGVSKLFGFELMSNFKFPYFSRNIGEFWKRWHISLSTWFRDYVYIPLGGSKVKKILAVRNILIIFLVSGFWHGANWTFIFWGLIHFLLYIPSFLSGNSKEFSSSVVAENRWMPSFIELFKMISIYFGVTVAWIFFRSDTISDSFNYIKLMFTNVNLPNSKLQGVGYIIILIALDWLIRRDERNPIFSKNPFLRYLIYTFLAYQVIVNFGKVKTDFIYFQF